MDVSSSLCPKIGQNSYISIVEIWCTDFRKKREERIFLMISNVKIFVHLLLLWECLERKEDFQPSRYDHCKGASTLVRSKGLWSNQSLIWIPVEAECLCGYKRPSNDIYDHQFALKIDLYQDILFIYFFIWFLYLNLISHMMILFMVWRFDLMHA